MPPRSRGAALNKCISASTPANISANISQVMWSDFEELMAGPGSKLPNAPRESISALLEMKAPRCRRDTHAGAAERPPRCRRDAARHVAGAVHDGHRQRFRREDPGEAERVRVEARRGERRRLPRRGGGGLRVRPSVPHRHARLLDAHHRRRAQALPRGRGAPPIKLAHAVYEHVLELDSGTRRRR